MDDQPHPYKEPEDVFEPHPVLELDQIHPGVMADLWVRGLAVRTYLIVSEPFRDEASGNLHVLVVPRPELFSTWEIYQALNNPTESPIAEYRALFYLGLVPVVGIDGVSRMSKLNHLAYHRQLQAS